jgi:uncharacterized protein (TIGR02757 family)
MPRTPRKSRPDLPRLADHLSRLRAEWAGRRLDSDPLLFPHRYEAPPDREVVAFLSASLAFGRVASIRASLERVLDALGPSPAGFLVRWDGSAITGLERFRHRWVGPDDLAAFLRAIATALREHGSLGALFAAGDGGEADFVPALDRFYDALRRTAGPTPSRGLRFLLPVPGDGSACKRSHLFLRWMVRRSDLDLGLWGGGAFDPARLLLPLDTHVHRISTYLGLTARPAADLAAAREATACLARIDPADPVSFDWALSRLGILAECVRDPHRSRCGDCAIRPVCRAASPSGRPPVLFRATGALPA